MKIKSGIALSIILAVFVTLAAGCFGSTRTLPHNAADGSGSASGSGDGTNGIATSPG